MSNSGIVLLGESCTDCKQRCQTTRDLSVSTEVALWPSDQASGCFWSHTLKTLLIWAHILVSSDCKTRWLDSNPGPRFQYHGGQNTFVA